MNKFQEALKRLKNFFGEHSPYNKELNIIQELVDKETPMKVNQNDYRLEDCDDDYDYFPVMIHLYKCPNCKCKPSKIYKLTKPQKRCEDCNQLLDWSD